MNRAELCKIILNKDAEITKRDLIIETQANEIKQLKEGFRK